MGVDIETRRIINVGKRSFAITLPKRWIYRYNLKSGDIIEVQFNEDGSLTLKPAKSRLSDVEYRSVNEIKIDKIPQNIDVVALLTRYYIIGYESIAISTSIVTREEVNEACSKLIGSFFVEDGGFYRIIFALSESKISLDNIIDRMSKLLFEVTDLYIDYLNTGDPIKINELLAREEDIDRMYYLGMRVSNKILTSVISDGDLSSIRKFMFLTLGLKIVEEIADSFDRSVRAIMRSGLEVSTAIPKDFEYLTESVVEMVVSATNAFQTMDVYKALKILRMRREIKKNILKFKNYDNELVQTLLSEIETIVTLSADLSELTMIL